MNILVISQHYYPEQFRITDICESLVTEGHKVTVLTGLPNYPHGKVYSGYRSKEKRQEIINGVKVVRTPIIPRGNNILGLTLNYLSFAFNASLKVLFLKKNYDVVYVYQTSPVTMAIPALFYKKLTGKKVIHYCLDLWPESIAAVGIKNKSIIYKILLMISRKIYNSADQIHITSELFANYFKNIIKLKDLKKIEYRPQYAEDLYEINQEISRVENRKPINLLFAGNIGRMQSVETIILAAAELKNIDHIKWHIVGDGSDRMNCEKLVVELGLEEKVIFYGQKPVEEMPSFFDMASALLVTLKDNEFISYTMPGKVQSYMAAGKPVLGAINGETKRVIEESKCGLCCKAEDYKEFAKKVRRFALNTEMHNFYKENARIYYETYFAKNIFIKKLNDTLMEMRG
jgi:glycosyltransferase involved in cell wall biosynthesis